MGTFGSSGKGRKQANRAVRSKAPGTHFLPRSLQRERRRKVAPAERKKFNHGLNDRDAVMCYPVTVAGGSGNAALPRILKTEKLQDIQEKRSTGKKTSFQLTKPGQRTGFM